MPDCIANDVDRTEDPRFSLIELILDKARPDVHAERTWNSEEKRNVYYPRTGKISSTAILNHLSAGPYLGIYLMKPGSITTNFAVLDFDDHAEKLDWSKLVALALPVIQAAKDRGLYPWVVRSGSGRGLHAWFFWTDPQPAAGVRSILRDVLKATDFVEGDKDLELGHIAIYPGQAEVAEDGKGDLIALPFGRKSVPLDEEYNPCPAPKNWITNPPVRTEITAAPNAPVRPRLPDHLVDSVAAKEAINHLDCNDRDIWFKVGMALKFDLGDAGFPIWEEWSKKSPKYDARSQKTTWNSFKRDGGSGAVVTMQTIFRIARETGWPGSGLIAPMYSDEYLALEFAKAYEHDLRYTDKLGVWHIWDGTRWREDDTRAAQDRSREHCRVMAQRANKKQEKIASAAASSNVLKLAQSDRRFATPIDRWDGHPWLLATPGGTVDLRTGQMRLADPADYLTRSTSVAPTDRPLAEACPIWLKALDDIFEGDAQKIDFLQQYLGYSLSGDTREEKCLLQHGTGGNGKDTIIETAAGVMGDNATVVATTVLMETKYTGHPTDIAKLEGARFAYAAEIPKNARWNINIVKQITGGGKITARAMAQNPRDFHPTCKLVISGNSYPAFGHADPAMRRRMLVLEYLKKFPGNTKLKDALKVEAPGILAWLIAGCVRYCRNGLVIPKNVRDDTDAYLNRMDDLSLWLAECCVQENDPTGRRVTTAELLKDYSGWREKTGAEYIHANAFPDRLRALGVEVDRTRSNSCRYVHKLRLISHIEARGEEEDAAELLF